MNDLVLNQNQTNGGVITLKEITDIIKVRHDKAMIKVEQLAKEPSFGEVSKMDTFNLNNVKVITYVLNKKQAIAVGAKLNNSLLMKVIDRLEELEKENNTFVIPSTFSEALLLASKQAEQIEKQNALLLEQKPKVEFFEAVTSSKSAIDMGQVAKVLDKDIGRNKLFEILRNKKILQKDNIPFQTYIDRGYFRVIEVKYTKPDGSTNISLKTLVYQKGVSFINKVLESWYDWNWKISKKVKI